MKKIILGIVLLMVLFLSGCRSLETSKIIIANKELSSHESTNMTLIINTTGLFMPSEPQSYYIQIISGEHLTVSKEEKGDQIKSDAAYNVTRDKVITYYLRAEYISSAQEVERVDIILTSQDSKLTQKLHSDFILIKRK